VYEVVAEPRERLEQAQQVERRENQAQGPVDPGVEQQSQGKPRCMIYYFKLCLTIYLLLVHYVSGTVWNPSCMIPRFP